MQAMMQALENRWKCNVCGHKYTEDDARSLDNHCCQKFMTKTLVLVHKA